MMKRVFMALVVCAAMQVALGNATTFQDGGDRLVEKQYTDGSWGWPLDAPPTYGNIIGPIGMGLAQTYTQTGDVDHYNALNSTAAYLQSKTVFSPSDGYLAVMLDNILGGTANVDYVKANFYDKLAAGTYLRNGVMYDTAGYVSLIDTARAGQGIANLAAWDIGMGLYAANLVGADTTAWVDGTKNEIDQLNGSASYDVIGLAGAVMGLAAVGEDFDPTAGEHAAAANIDDLADILAGYQIASGGFAWNSNYVADGEEAVQETAYSLLALNEMDRAGYINEIALAGGYLESVQLATGGWENYSGSGENNEVTGEALWASVVAVPAPGALLLGTMGVGIVSWLRKRRTL